MFDDSRRDFHFLREEIRKANMSILRGYLQQRFRLEEGRHLLPRRFDVSLVLLHSSAQTVREYIEEDAT